jgi:hypothetical protein
MSICDRARLAFEIADLFDKLDAGDADVASMLDSMQPLLAAWRKLSPAPRSASHFEPRTEDLDRVRKLYCTRSGDLAVRAGDSVFEVLPFGSRIAPDDGTAALSLASWTTAVLYFAAVDELRKRQP